MLRGQSSCVLFKPSTDWMRPTQIMEGHLLYPKPTDLNINLIQKHPHRNIQGSVCPNIWAPDLAKWHMKLTVTPGFQFRLGSCRSSVASRPLNGRLGAGLKQGQEDSAGQRGKSTVRRGLTGFLMCSQPGVSCGLCRVLVWVTASLHSN